MLGDVPSGGGAWRYFSLTAARPPALEPAFNRSHGEKDRIGEEGFDADWLADGVLWMRRR